ncbi:DoxX-like family protein [Shouchella shacheensis]|uniref:DoxX-like family protein n=1 Tax=Shouchella shacheensis TaxID=1649580 RepID=UPI0007404278|nr:DoxX-like family protein [Shouchella shacheensis]
MNLKPRAIYVETMVHSEMERVWHATQDPALHEKWDLRFSSITYIEKESPHDDQRFTYTTKIGFGVTISGEGLSRGEAEKDDGSCVSALSFSSEQPVSLIAKGNGYWRYVPKENGVQFMTRYDYQTRWGKVGTLIDRLVFRPLLGWATAWSFEAMRLWLEEEIHPRESKRRSFLHILFSLAVAFIWFYQGLVPKLLFPETGEIQLLQASGLVAGYEEVAVALIGVLQMLFGLLFLLPIPKRMLFLGSAGAVAVLGVGALLSTPGLYLDPFNPAVVNVSMLVLCVAGWGNAKNLVLARRCKRRASS